MGIAEAIIPALLGQFYIVSLVAGILGEEATLLLAFLASKNMMHLWVLMFVAPFGLLIGDILYFYLGKIKTFKKMGDKIHDKHMEDGIAGKIVRFGKKYPIIALILSKFIYGTRIPVVVYYHTREMKLGLFMIYDFIALVIWTVIMIPLAWLAGRGLTSGLHLAKDFSAILGIAILFLVALYLIDKAIAYYIAKKNKNLEYYINFTK